MALVGGVGFQVRLEPSSEDFQFGLKVYFEILIHRFPGMAIPNDVEFSEQGSGRQVFISGNEVTNI